MCLMDNEKVHLWRWKQMAETRKTKTASWAGPWRSWVPLWRNMSKGLDSKGPGGLKHPVGHFFNGKVQWDLCKGKNVDYYSTSHAPESAPTVCWVQCQMQAPRKTLDVLIYSIQQLPIEPLLLSLTQQRQNNFHTPSKERIRELTQTPGTLSNWCSVLSFTLF